jgi:lipopolysaccharide export system ATP-binding protein
MTLLSAKNLKKSLKGRAVVKNISLHIARGECVGLLGPNGAGKTTCFYLLVGLLKTDEGEILLDGKSITKTTMDERARLGLGYLPQEASVFRKLSVEDNILAILELRKDLKRSARRERLEALLEEFNLIPVRKTLGMRLSGGERRRVEIARALAINPNFILLDEPFAGVDPISVIEIKKIIEHLCQSNIGVLITDHHVRETLAICQRAYIMNQGQHLCEGTPENILANQEVRAVYLGEEFKL